MRASASANDMDLRLVRPRKLAAYENIPDLLDQRNFCIGENSFEFIPAPSNKFINLVSLSEEISVLPEFANWKHHVALEPPLLLAGVVVKGFGRGSKQLGVPTANLDMTEENRAKTANLVPGVYAAKAQLQLETDAEPREYLCAMSIGWNPVYDNDEKTIEAFLIHDFEGQEFYGT